MSETSATQGSARRTRTALSHPAVISAAVALADEIGAHALTLRRLAQHLGVSPMAIYHHVADKEQILDGMVDAVFTEIDLPADPDGWRDAMDQRARATRAVLGRHPWAVGLLDSRSHPGPATLAHHEWVLRRLREGGFTVARTAHAFAVLDSFVYGFALQEASMPFDSSAGPSPELAEEMGLHDLAGAYPHLAEMAGHALSPGYSFASEFDVGLALVLDGLERLRGADRADDRPAG